ncbi:hypothetical protein NLG97_g4447 [Lecanicillium saksenae]|uniref:Uncharacterized protein n=1 Tax=Lecanicillium saksenae TaxID=468837 RepID=A0ACC1QWM4_9HYPO|nr:hypothetical protein NLG97_g4447 [Lecanicillium saksenae]
MLATARLARASRNRLPQAPRRVTAGCVTLTEPCHAWGIPSGRKRLHTSQRFQRNPTDGHIRRAEKETMAQRVKGTWERPSESRPGPAQKKPEEWMEQMFREQQTLREQQMRWEQHMQWERERLRARAGSNHPPRKTATEAASGPQPNLRVIAVVLAAVAFYIWNSQKVPLTGRWRFNFLSDSVTDWLHRKEAQAMLKHIHDQGGLVLPDSDLRTQIVKNIMRRLVPLSGLTHLDWEVYVIADDATANAFVLPGGKVFVFSGLFGVSGNEDALAAVLGHEIAHETASHTAERMSLAWVANLTAGSLFFLAGALPGLALFAMWTVTGAFVLPALVYELPMSRTHEYEADHIGLMMMAEACYDPRTAIPFWRRMNEQGQEMEEVLSTHPTNDHRIAKLEQLMPEAMARREQSDCSGTESFARRFRFAVKQKRSEMPSPQTA